MPALTKPVALLLLFFLVPGKAMFSMTFFEEKKYNIDSLEKVLLTATGEERVRTLCLLAGQYRINDAQKSIVLAEEAYRISKQLEDPGTGLLATYTLGMACHHAADYPLAVRYSLDALGMAEKQHDTMMVYRTMHIIVLSYLYSNNSDLAIGYLFKVMEYFEPWQLPEQKFEMNIRLGWVYMMTGKYREAIPYFLEAAKNADSSGRISPHRVMLNYAHLARCYMKEEDYDSMKMIIDLREQFVREHNVLPSEITLEYRAEYFFGIKNYDSALVYYRKRADMARKDGDIYSLADNYVAMGRVYRLTGNQGRAIEAYAEAAGYAKWVSENKSYNLDRGKSLDNWFTPEQSVPDYLETLGLRRLITAHSNLYEIYKSLDDSRNALLQLEAVNEATNRLRELDRKKEVIEINTRYETERKEQQIRLLTSENELSSMKLEQTRYLLFASGGLIVLAILVAILLIRQNRMKALQDKTILEQKLLRAQMNPHFLFNTLTNIQGYMLENDTQSASHYLSRFSRLMRNILDDSSRESVPLEQEISTIENYLELQKIRYKGKFDYEIDVDEHLDPEGTFIPPMLAQPIIENAIEHGIKHREEKGLINVSFRIDGENDNHGLAVLPSYRLIIIEVTDNGVGRQQSGQIEQGRSRDHRPMAISITKERLRGLSRKVRGGLRRKIRMVVEDLVDPDGMPAGTKVGIILPADFYP